MQLLSSEKADRKTDQLCLEDTISQLQRNLQSKEQAAEGKIQIYLRVQIVKLRWKLLNPPSFSAEERDLWSTSGAEVIR